MDAFVAAIAVAAWLLLMASAAFVLLAGGLGGQVTDRVAAPPPVRPPASPAPAA